MFWKSCFVQNKWLQVWQNSRSLRCVSRSVRGSENLHQNFFKKGDSLVKFQGNFVSNFKEAKLCNNFIEINEIYIRVSPLENLPRKL